MIFRALVLVVVLASISPSSKTSGAVIDSAPPRDFVPTIKPSAAARGASAQRASESLSDVLNTRSKCEFFLFTSDRELSVAEFVSQGNHFRYRFDHPGELTNGLATGFSPDGYLLTAAHVAGQYVWVIGWMGGELRVAPARVVCRQHYGTFGAELAVLKVDATIDQVAPLGTLDASDRQIFAYAWDREPQIRLFVLAGQSFSRTISEGDARVSVVGTNLPTWRGDSGGGLLSRDGKLVGVVFGYRWTWSTRNEFNLGCLIEKDLVEEIVLRDRARGASPSFAAATE